MLELVHCFVGCPSSDVHILTLSDEILLAYAFADCVVLLDARTFTFKRALTFREVFPSARDTNEHISCISIEPSMKLIAASLGPKVALWALSDVQKDAWRVFSSLCTVDGQPVTALDCKSGLLGVGSVTGLSVYTLGLEDGLPVWTQKWFIPTLRNSVVRFSPSLMHLATISPDDNVVRLYSTASGKLLQSLRHPRPVKDFIWRFSEKSSRDDLILYTVTIDATLRIFLPVLDTPHFLQLHAALDFDSDAPGSSNGNLKGSNIFCLHKDTVANSFSAILSQNYRTDQENQYRRLKEMNGESWDFFVRVFPDNSLVVSAVANIDRRPPTLLKQFTLLRSPPATLVSYPRHLHVLKTPSHASIIFVTSPPLRTYEMDPLQFFEDGTKGMALLSQGSDFNESETSKILRFVRTPEGGGLAIVREHFVEAWNVHSGTGNMKCLGRWQSADLVTVLNRGRCIALYSEAEQASTLTVHYCSSPIPSKSIPVPQLISLFCLPSGSTTSLIGVTPSYDIVRICIRPNDSARTSSFELTSLTSTRLPTSDDLSLVLPVDPMAWSNVTDPGREHDTLLSVSKNGDLAFWLFDEDDSHSQWKCTGRVKTGRSGYRLARCSSAKKTALVFPGQNGDELRIWDSRESEFTSGLEFSIVYGEEPINDLDWTSTPDTQSILAIGFSQHVDIFCQQRMTYFEENSAWGALGRVTIGHMLTHNITDSIWLAGGTLLIGAGHHMLQYGQCKPHDRKQGSALGLFERVAWMNGPLPDYHPQMILQCLLWGKIELVKEIIENLYHYLVESSTSSEWINLPIDRFLEVEEESRSSKVIARTYHFGVLDNDGSESLPDEEENGRFSRALVQRLLEELETEPLEHLTPNEHAHLIVLIQTRLEIEEQKRSLDANGLRYLISMRSFYILNARMSSPKPPGTPASGGSSSLSSSSKQIRGRERLRFRDMVWAFHSESQEILLAASASACRGKMKWADARALGIFMWLTSVESMRAQLEDIARNHYMSGDNRDPTACSLFYFALGKVRLVHGLWRQAVWHKEQPLMLKFLSNDFTQSRWRTAALKNAYALLGKQRFDYAAAFFILGGGLKDAVNVCVKQLNDFQLAIALARVVEPEGDRPILKGILTTVVVPHAFEKGNRWLGSWAFWLLNRRDLAVRILVSPLEDVSKALDIPIKEIGDPNYDDPSLALLFSQLRLKTLQTAKGTNEISGRTEFNFILQTARVFSRMGCHALALDLVRSWSFYRPAAPTHRIEPSGGEDTIGPLPSSARPSIFAYPKHSRRSSILIDMDISPSASTRTTTPEPTATKPGVSVTMGEGKTNGEAPSGKETLGGLLKTAKQDVSVPEFDMSAFF